MDKLDLELSQVVEYNDGEMDGEQIVIQQASTLTVGTIERNLL